MDWILPLSWTWQGANSLNSVSTVNYWVSSVKEFHSQEFVLYLMYQYSFILLPKMYAPCPNPSPIWVTSDVPKVIIVIIQIFMWCVVIDICYMFNFICICPAPFMLHPIPHVSCLNAFMVCFKKHLISFNSLITWAKIAHSVSLFVAHIWRYGMREYTYIYRCIQPLTFVWYTQNHLWHLVSLTSELLAHD